MPLSNQYPSLSDRTVFVTGGGSGIGADIVRGLADQGSRIGFIDIDAAASIQLCDEIETAVRLRPWFEQVDVRDIAALSAAMSEAAAYHKAPLHGLVNNAARDDRHRFQALTPDAFNEHLNVNLRPHFFAMQKAADLMTDGGSVINMGSVSWMRRRPGFVGYTTAKGAIHALTRTMAQELGPLGIRVNSVVPGAVVTERQKHLWLDQALEQSFIDEQALKFRLQPDDIVAMTLFLLSDDARACSGQNFIVDGGIV